MPIIHLLPTPQDPESIPLYLNTNFNRLKDAIEGTSGGGDSFWNTPDLGGTWVDYGSGWGNLEFIKHPDGEVIIKGVIKDGAIGLTTPVFNLPEGYRPLSTAMFPSVSWDGVNYVVSAVQIESNGNVFAAVGANSFFSMDGVHFKAEI